MRIKNKVLVLLVLGMNVSFVYGQWGEVRRDLQGVVQTNDMLFKLAEVSRRFDKAHNDSQWTNYGVYLRRLARACRGINVRKLELTNAQAVRMFELFNNILANMPLGLLWGKQGRDILFTLSELGPVLLGRNDEGLSKVVLELLGTVVGRCSVIMDPDKRMLVRILRPVAGAQEVVGQVMRVPVVRGVGLIAGLTLIP